MAKVSTLYRPGYGPDDHDDENAFGVPPAGVVLGRDYSDASDDRGLDEWLSKQADRSPEMKAVTTPGAVQTDSPDDSADLDKYIDQVAPKDTGDAGYHPDQSHDDESWLQANASPRQPVAPQYGTEPDSVTKGAIIASGIGSFLQRKPFDSQFWGGQQQSADRLQHQAAADSQSRQIAQLRSEELAQRADSLRQHMADNQANRGVREGGLANAKARTDVMRTTAEANASHLQTQDDILKENASATGDRAIRMQEFFIRNGIPMRKVQGLSPDDMKQLSPELEKAFNLAEPQVRAEVGLAGRKAGAESNARFPNEEKLAHIRGDIQDTNAQHKSERTDGGYGDEQAADDIQRILPWFKFRGEAGKRKWLSDEKNRFLKKKHSDKIETIARAHAATERMNEILDQTSIADWASDPEAKAAVESEYRLFRNEHVGIIQAIEGINGGGTEFGRSETKEELPETFNPAARARMRGIQKFLHGQADATLSGYGAGVDGEFNPGDFEDGSAAQPRAAQSAPHSQRAARRPAPPMPALAPDETFAPMKVYNATSPSGKKAQRSYTDDEAAKLKAKGYTLEAVQ